MKKTEFQFFHALVLFLSLFFPFLSSAQAVEEKHELRTSIQISDVINDNFKFKLTTVQPQIFYRYTSPQAFRVSTLIGVLYNRIDLAQALSSNWSVMTGMESFITLAGDEPRVDGDDLSEYEFYAHRFPFYVGAQWKTLDSSDFPLEIRGFWEVDYLTTYDESKDASFIAPSFQWETGPWLRIRWGSGGGSEISDKGSRIQAVSTYRMRFDNDPWGAVGFPREADRFFKSSIGLVLHQELAPTFWLVAKSQASLVSNVDRLNALKSMNFSQESSSFGADDERAEKAATAEVGLRYYFSPDFTIRPFVHALVYRELTPTRFRNESGAGAGLKLTGRAFSENFGWDLQYANLMGTRNDQAMLHHLRLFLSYQFY